MSSENLFYRFIIKNLFESAVRPLLFLRSVARIKSSLKVFTFDETAFMPQISLLNSSVAPKMLREIQATISLTRKNCRNIIEEGRA